MVAAQALAYYCLALLTSLKRKQNIYVGLLGTTRRVKSSFSRIGKAGDAITFTRT